MIQQIKIGNVKNNFSYFVGREKGAIVDPSSFEVLEKEMRKRNFKPEMILITHSHFDHVEGANDFILRYQLPIYMHKLAVDKIKLPENAKVNLVDEGDVIMVNGGLKLKVLYTPGHSDDAVCYYAEMLENFAGEVAKLITGDTLFVETCGRADLPGSNVNDLFASLQRIKALPENTEIYCGHDYGSKPISNLAWEKEHNKFLGCETLEEFIALRM